MRIWALILPVVCLSLSFFAGCQGDDTGISDFTDAGTDAAVAPGIVVSNISGNTREDGTQATFSVALTSKPSADVVVNFDSNDKTEGTVDKIKLTFTPVNFRAPQTVTVTGVNDDLQDGNQTYAIVFAATTSTDAAYSAIRPGNVSIINVDNDTAGITVSAISGRTNESGARATFTVVLNSQPSGDVTVHFDSSDKAEGVVDKTSAIFTATNWKAPQTVTVTGVDDDLVDGNQTFAIAFTATTSTDAAYAAITPDSVSVVNVDNDTPGFTLGAINGRTGEDGTRATFTIVLNSRPAANVVVHFDSSDLGEGTVAVTALTFTPVNWNAPQTITVTGVNDDLADGNQPYAIVFSATTSTDAAYAAIVPASVAVINVDDDGANITVSAISGRTGENGAQATFTVVLNSRPTASVIINFDSNDNGEGTVNHTSLTFTAVNWNAPQTVTVTGVNDDLADGNQPYSIVFSATASSDAAYAAITPASVAVVNVDNDTAGISVSPISGRTSENGLQATFTVVLNARPTAAVTVNFDSSDNGEGTVDRTSVTFTTVNWNAPRTVIVTGVNDDLADSIQPYSIVFSATTSADAAYAAITPQSIAVFNLDNDTAGITVGDISGATGEDGTQATFTVVLNAEPTGNVTVHFDSNDIGEGTVGAPSLTFTQLNWNAPQTVTVSGVNDDLADGNQPYAIVFAATTGSDVAYDAITPPSVAVSNVDDDTASISVSAISGPTGEDGTQATFTVVLNSQPTADVTVQFNTNNSAEGTLDRTSLTFTPINWNAPQTVNVTGINDDLADGDQPYAIVFSATTSGDGAYAVITPANVAVSNVDNDTAGITVSAMSGATREDGTQATFTVVLHSRPFADVAIGFDSSDTGEGTVDRTTLTFTAVNWNAPQTVTVTGINDDVADGNQPYSIIFVSTVSTDAAYAVITPPNVSASNIDDDTAGITVGAISGMTGENGAQATFTVVLNSQPTANVTVNFNSDTLSEGTPDRTSLTFTPVNWNAPQTVIVTGINDALADGTQPYAIVFTATTSTDAAYAAITPANVLVSNVDNDTAGITVSAISGNTAEDGTQATFTVVLNSQPFGDVTVHFNSDDLSEGTVDRASLTFTALSWSAPQTVTVTGINDALADGAQPYNVDFSATTSTDAAYAVITPGSVAVSNIDNDSAGITVSAISGNTAEGGGQATFTVVLNSQPFADVTLHLNSDDLGEGTVDSTSLAFTPVNWNAPQTVTVTGVNDDLADGTQPYAIGFGATTSSDPAYAILTPADVLVSNVDNDTAGISVSAISGNTTEANGQATFTVVLNSQPFASVIVHLNSNDTTEGTVDKTSLTFTAANWNAPQTVTVTGVNDDLADGTQPYAIAFTATTSTDPAYAIIRPANVAVSNTDNDTAGITVSAISGNTSEAGGQATFTAVLNSQPFGDVTLSFTSNDTTEGTIDKTSLTFTSVNWNAPQTVTVTGVNDDLADGTHPYAIVFTATASSDLAYAVLTPGNVIVSNTDNDTGGITVSAISGTTGEDGTQATFTVVLNSQPFAVVTVHLNSDDLTEGTVDQTSLTFTAVNWSAPQTVTVTGANDVLADGTQQYQIDFTATTSTDLAYAVITPPSVTVSNIDNDSAGITVSAISSNTTEFNGQAHFTVVLNSQPFADVTVHLDSNDATEGTVDITSLTFTPVNWNSPRTITVTGVNDDLDDGTQPYAIAFGATTSTDPAYAVIRPANVNVRNTDNDTAGITVSTISRNTSEDGVQATFTVVLNSQPFATTTVHFNSNNTDEGTVDQTSLTFTAVNWNAPQTVTVTGINDNLADGTHPYAIAFTATTGSDPAYAAITPGNVLVSNTDNDTAGITVSTISRNTSEDGVQATFTVVLNSQPFADVTLHLDSNNATEGTVGSTSLLFTAVNWNAPQTVIVTGVNDDLADGTQPYAIAFGDTTSADTAYANITPANVIVSNTDNDTAGITVSPISGNTSEFGGEAFFTVVLNSQPFATTTVHFDSNDPTEGNVEQTSLVFTAVNWNAPQTVTVTGANDDFADGTQPYAIAFTAATGSDEAYAVITPANVVVSNTDNDTAGITVSAVSGNTSEAGGQATFTVRLNSRPFADVTVHFDSNDTAEGTLSATSLTFSGPTSLTPQTVTITGIDDSLADGNQPYAVVFTATTSSDTAYSPITPANVLVTNVDNDTAGILVSAISGNTSEAGVARFFTVRLRSQPFADVTVNLNSNDTTEGTLDKTSLLFTSVDWNTAQTVTATGQDDGEADGNQVYSVVFTSTVSGDAAYAVITPANVSIINLDNDSAAILVSAISGTTSEGGAQATFTVRLNSLPFGDVTVHFNSNDATEGTLDKTSLTFTAGNWSVLQTVTVTGQDDAIVDGNITYAVVFTPTTSTSPSDAPYAAITPSNIVVTNLDNDTAVVAGYSLSYTQDQLTSAATCNPWHAFTSTLTGAFSSITFSGSNDPTGKTCSNRDSATALCNALQAQSDTEVDVICGADTWRVGTCYTPTSMELSINASICVGYPASAHAYTIRPCEGVSDGGDTCPGGINTDTCETPTQTFAISCTR